MGATIGIIVIVVIAAFLGYVASRPNHFRVERSTTINAPPETIYPLINDFRNWQTWSPWDERDPAIQRTYSGAPNGPGAVYEWLGNSKVGAGRMEIADATAASKVVIDLHFLKPFEGRNVAEFTMEPNGGTTRVTWGVHGPVAFGLKAMGVFMSMDQMMGKDFEHGLAKMKTVAER